MCLFRSICKYTTDPTCYFTILVISSSNVSCYLLAKEIWFPSTPEYVRWFNSMFYTHILLI